MSFQQQVQQFQQQFQQQGFSQGGAEDPLGKRVKRGRDWKWMDQDGNGEGTVLKRARGNDGWLKVKWDNGNVNNYRWGAEGCYDLTIVGVAKAGLLIGRRVRRGRDWKWGDQDGNGGLGIIVGAPQDNVVEVRWYTTGQSNQYRWGIENAYDVTVVSDSKPGSSHAPGAQQEGERKGPSGATPLEVLWNCMLAMHKSIDPEALGPVNISKPTNMAGFYNCLYKYECSIKEGAQTPEWKAFRRAHWEREMKSDRCDGAHAATMLVAVEMNIIPQAQKPEWREERKPWLQALQRIGAEELQYPMSSGSGSKVVTSDSLGRGLPAGVELELLWNSLVSLHKSIDPAALGKIQLSKPADVRGFYQALWKYECSIKEGAQTPEWKAFRRAQWEAEMKGPRCDGPHAATMLIAVEMNILGQAQVGSWREQRKPWLAALIALGGREMEWTAPVSSEDSGFGSSELSYSDQLNVLWACLVALHKSVIPEALGPIQLSKPTNLEGFYNCIWKYECAITIHVQTPEWKAFRRAHWEREMKGPRCDAAHAATMLVALEMNVIGAAQKPEWREERRPWLAALARLGAWDLQYPSPFSGGEISH